MAKAQELVSKLESGAKTARKTKEALETTQRELVRLPSSVKRCCLLPLLEVM